MKSKLSKPEETKLPNETTEYNNPEPECSKALNLAQQELAEKEAIILNLRSKIQFMEQKTSSLEKIIAQKKLTGQRIVSPVYNKKESVLPKAVKPSKNFPKTSLPPDILYKNSHIFLKKKQFADAQKGFTSLARQFPNHDLADNALYWLGECHYAQENYTYAIDTFKSLIQKYPKAEKVPDALLKTGFAYSAKNDLVHAKKYLSKLLKSYPFSPAASKAQKKLSSFE